MGVAPEDAVHEGEGAVALLPYPAGGAESTLIPANLGQESTCCWAIARRPSTS